MSIRWHRNNMNQSQGNSVTSTTTSLLQRACAVPFIPWRSTMEVGEHTESLLVSWPIICDFTRSLFFFILWTWCSLMIHFIDMVTKLLGLSSRYDIKAMINISLSYLGLDAIISCILFDGLHVEICNIGNTGDQTGIPNFGSYSWSWNSNKL